MTLLTLCWLSQAIAQSVEANESPGVAALVNLSTDIAVVVPKEIHAEKNSDGSLYVTHLTVLRSLKGTLSKAKIVPLRYGFIFSADGVKVHALAKPKFVVGQKYIVFLIGRSVGYSPASSDPHSPTDFDKVIKNGEVDYHTVELSDEWLGVVDEDTVLEATIAALSRPTSD